MAGQHGGQHGADAAASSPMWATGFVVMALVAALLSYRVKQLSDAAGPSTGADIGAGHGTDNIALGGSADTSTEPGPTTRLVPSATVQATLNRRYVDFRRNYLTVYLCMMAGDWLQGPYVYPLYKSYGYGLEEIGILFVVGFLSSALFGTVISSYADTVGRKKMCLLFAVVYIGSCLTKLSPNFHVLMLGRFLGGISTSLLFSVFEAWMVNAHNARGFSPEQLSTTFSWATYGNGLVAILCGMLSNAAVNVTGSLVSPFMLAIVFLAAGGVLVAQTWTENYGQSLSSKSTGERQSTNSLLRGLKAVMNDRRCLCTGIIVSLFEGSMYTFVFMWGPALEEAVKDGSNSAIPFGLIFATFMVALMVGSLLFRVSLASKWAVEQTVQPMLLIAAGSLALPAMFRNEAAVFWAFNVFEICCGIYFPVAGTMRGKYVPEETRATVMNLFRVPLNMIVVVTLTRVSEWSQEFIFGLCATLVFVAYVASTQLAKSVQPLLSPLPKPVSSP